MRHPLIPALTLIVTVGLSSAAQSAFVVSPMELHLQTAPGGAENATITARNTGLRPLLLKLYLADSRFGVDGAEEDLPLGDLEQSCAPWITLDTPLLELPAGGSKVVELRFAVPSEARGSYWTKIYFEEISQPEPVRRELGSRRYQVYIKQRMGVRIFAELPGTADDEAIVEHVEVRTEGSGRSFAVLVGNPGRTLLRCEGRVELRDSHGRVAETLELGAGGEFVVFPRGRRALAIEGGRSLAPGDYTALAIIDYGGETLVAGEALFAVAGSALLSDGEQQPADGRAAR